MNNITLAYYIFYKSLISDLIICMVIFLGYSTHEACGLFDFIGFPWGYLMEFPKDVVLGKPADSFLSPRVSSFDDPLSSSFSLLCRACRLCAGVVCKL